MKRKFITIFWILPFLLAGCMRTNNTEAIRDVQSEALSFSEASTVSQEEISMKKSVPSCNETLQTTVTKKAENETSVYVQTTVSDFETMRSDTKVDLSPSTVINYEETHTSTQSTVKTESPQMTVTETKSTDTGNIIGSSSDDITVYIDKKTEDKYIILNVTPQKIYWNEIEDYTLSVGQSVDIPIPAIFKDWVIDTDEIMIYINEARCFKDINIDNKIIKGIAYPQYWSKDYLCPIIEGKVCLGEYTDEIKSFFSRIDDGVYIEEANYYYPENPFTDGMSIDSLDIYFEQIKTDYDALLKEMEDHPDRNYDIAGFWGYQDGVRFRAIINYIY